MESSDSLSDPVLRDQGEGRGEFPWGSSLPTGDFLRLDIEEMPSCSKVSGYSSLARLLTSVSSPDSSAYKVGDNMLY